ncbi:MAG: 4-hydroxythreonine-4-phosphate dehydrogenase PdxA [Pelagibacteraceae bacterium]|jgi:4-hydroxythreonine-4-phosphate dehydrogenase|nr:4-hydroxythreonine-4-phosphate dehydrogenase PdxA [Pelagibacteraceae bacterium]
MKDLIAIIAGEPESINSEIIAKAWKKKKIKNIFIIGNFSILKKQIKKLGIKIPLIKIQDLKDVKKHKKLCILDVPLKFRSVFNINRSQVKNYIFKSFDIAHKLAIKKEVKGFINAPVDKKIFNSKYPGVTEYLSYKNNTKNKEIMFIHNKKISVVPLTTHIKIKNVTNKISFNLIKTKIILLNNSYFNLFKIKPKIAILGLNPHNSENEHNSIENKIIRPAITKLKKLKININGPFPADTAFNKNNILAYDVLVGMYHDQILAPFKALYGFDAINITLGLKYIRISPDHGTAKDIIGLNMANPESLINAINFLNKVND